MTSRKIRIDMRSRARGEERWRPSAAGRGSLGAALGLALLLASGPLHAAPPSLSADDEGPHPDLVLVTSHTLTPTPAERRMVQRVAQTLRGRVRSGPALARAAEHALGPRPRSLRPARRAALLDAIRDASEAAYVGKWAKAIRLLRWVRRELMAHPLTVIRQRPVFRVLQAARIQLALCYIRTARRKEAWRLMEEALRAEPGLTLATALHGPVIQRLFYQVKSQLDLRFGRLEVRTSPPGALIFLNGRNVGVSPADLPRLYPGDYELIVVHGDQVSRIRHVSIGTGRAQVSVDLAADAAVRTAGHRVGLRIPAGAKHKARETRNAVALAHHLHASRVLVVGIQRRRGQRALVGRTIRADDGKTLALAYVSLEPGPVPAHAPERLARFLVEGRDPGRGVVVGTLPRTGVGTAPGGLRFASRPATPRDADGSPGLRAAGWSLVAVGLAAIAGGGAAFGLDGVTYPRPTATRLVYRTGRLGAGLLAGGLATGITGAVLLIVDAVRRGRARRRAVRAQVVGGGLPGGGWVGVSGRF